MIFSISTIEGSIGIASNFEVDEPVRVETTKGYIAADLNQSRIVERFLPDRGPCSAL